MSPLLRIRVAAYTKALVACQNPGCQPKKRNADSRRTDTVSVAGGATAGEWLCHCIVFGVEKIFVRNSGLPDFGSFQYCRDRLLTIYRKRQESEWHFFGECCFLANGLICLGLDCCSYLGISSPRQRQIPRRGYSLPSRRSNAELEMVYAERKKKHSRGFRGELLSAIYAGSAFDSAVVGAVGSAR